jgi:hypothetical protein
MFKVYSLSGFVGVFCFSVFQMSVNFFNQLFPYFVINFAVSVVKMFLPYLARLGVCGW